MATSTSTRPSVSGWRRASPSGSGRYFPTNSDWEAAHNFRLARSGSSSASPRSASESVGKYLSAPEGAAVPSTYRRPRRGRVAIAIPRTAHRAWHLASGKRSRRGSHRARPSPGGPCGFVGWNWRRRDECQVPARPCGRVDPGPRRVDEGGVGVRRQRVPQRPRRLDDLANPPGCVSCQLRLVPQSKRSIAWSSPQNPSSTRSESATPRLRYRLATCATSRMLASASLLRSARSHAEKSFVPARVRTVIGVSVGDESAHRTSAVGHFRDAPRLALCAIASASFLLHPLSSSSNRRSCLASSTEPKALSRFPRVSETSSSATTPM